jgi:hypothetical protein
MNSTHRTIVAIAFLLPSILTAMTTLFHGVAVRREDVGGGSSGGGDTNTIPDPCENLQEVQLQLCLHSHVHDRLCEAVTKALNVLKLKESTRDALRTIEQIDKYILKIDKKQKEVNSLIGKELDRLKQRDDYPYKVRLF